MTNYLERLDGTILSEGNLLRSDNAAFIVPRIIDERLNQMSTRSKLNEVLNIPENKQSDGHWEFQRNIQIVDCFLDTCRMIQIEHKGYFTKNDISDSFLWLLNKPQYIGIYSWFNISGRSIESVVAEFVNIIINNVMFLPRIGLDPISKIYYLNNKFQLKNKDSISLMELHDTNIGGKLTLEYKLTEPVIHYLQIIEDTKRYSEFEINFESLQDQLQLDVLNPNDVLLKIRDSIQRLDILTQKVEEAYQKFIKNISGETVDSFFENVSNWHNQANQALRDGQKSLASLKNKVLSLQLQPNTSSSSKAHEKIKKWINCQEEEQKYINDLSKSLKLLSELTEKTINPKFSNIGEINLRNINEVFNIQSLDSIGIVSEYLAPLFISEKKHKMFNFEILFSSPYEARVKQAKKNQQLARQMLTSEQQAKIKEEQVLQNKRTLELVEKFLLALDKAVRPITAKEFLNMYRRKNENSIGQPLSELIIKTKELNHFFSLHSTEFRKILQALTVFDTTIPLKDVSLNGNAVGLNKATIAHCISKLQLDYFYIFKNTLQSEENTILTKDNREITNLNIAKVKKEELVDGAKGKDSLC